MVWPLGSDAYTLGAGFALMSQDQNAGLASVAVVPKRNTIGVLTCLRVLSLVVGTQLLPRCTECWQNGAVAAGN